MRYDYNDANVPIYAPNSFDGPHADPERAPDGGVWEFEPTAAGRQSPEPTGWVSAVRADYIEHAEDGDFAQAGTLVREVYDDAQRDRLVANVVGYVLGVCVSRCCRASSNTGGTWTPNSASASRKGVRAGLDG